MKRLLGVMILMSVAVVGCGGVMPQTPPPSPGAPVVEGPMVKTEDDGITMTVQVNAAVHRPDQPVEVTVTAKNTGTDPITWIGTSGCDNGLYVRVISPQGAGSFQLKSNGPPMACTAVMIEGKLEPGAQIEGEYTWDQMIDGVPASPGTHTLVAGFRRGVHFDQATPVEVQQEVRLKGGETFVSRDVAIKAATGLLENWFQTHTGDAVVRQEGDDWFVLLARSHDDPNGEWVSSSAEHAAEVARQKPEAIAEFKDGGWEVRFATKLGPAPREQVVFVNGTSGVGSVIE